MIPRTGATLAVARQGYFREADEVLLAEYGDIALRGRRAPADLKE